MRVLAIDPAVRNTGLAILDDQSGTPQVLHYDVLSFKSALLQSSCLAAINQALTHLIEHWQPDELAVEGIIYVQSHRTAISMGAARAAALIAAGKFSLPIYEYAPKRVKQAIVGQGNANKQQVAFMVRALLNLKQTPPHDAADAIAIGLAHLSASDPIKAQLIERRQV